MFDRLEIMQMAQSMARHAALRQTAVTQNIANADTPGYRARDAASFAQTYEADDAMALRQSRAGHMGAEVSASAKLLVQDGTPSPNGNSVSLEEEMVRAVDIRREHDLALSIYKSSLGILRSSLGRS
ncbi:FlgB family protein [Sedimentimonas flavescens]|uniref:FlgB family protein n=1 Tax=Sedimentimonas flavescens TaxID=2851012 RepID=A0ABT2ZZE5_9RHOB|nr:FlgB family protein [Sedimentimonas flavescens]MCT2539781.1 FlgB family protein [Sedimentimonas flavescens]MCV2878859.1 FlgB family protein [Sedimentimonas flavescens]